MKNRILLIIIIPFLTCCKNNSSESEMNQMKATIDSLTIQNKKSLDNLREMEWQRDQYKKKVESYENNKLQEENVNYCFVRFKYASDFNTSIQASSSPIKTLDNIDENTKAKFMDDMFKELEFKSPGKLYFRSRQFFAFKTYGEASESRLKNDGVTVNDIINDH
jgi:hypothetical protein